VRAPSRSAQAKVTITIAELSRPALSDRSASRLIRLDRFLLNQTYLNAGSVLHLHAQLPLAWYIIGERPEYAPGGAGAVHAAVRIREIRVISLLRGSLVESFWRGRGLERSTRSPPRPKAAVKPF
jgi:hypothetical protein